MASLVQTFRDLGRVKLAVLAGVATLLIAVFIFVSLRLTTPIMSPLYSGLSIEDSGRIVNELEQQSIKYELRSNGTQIAVPSDQVLRLRLSLAQEGIPTGGSVVGYEIFDRTEALGTSNFIMNVNMMRALEGELARTISSISSVDSTRVHLVMPKRELFSRDKQEPTASIVLKLKGGRELSKEEIRAITHLSATAVPGLKPTRVTIVDNYGRLLAKGGGDENSEFMSSDAQEFRVAYEVRMRETLENLLEKSVGPGKSKVQVNADIDFDRIVSNSEKFDPDSQVARSVQTNEEKEQSNEKNNQDNVSAGNNLPDSKSQQQDNGTLSSRNSEKNEETTNFEISKVTENHIKEMGTVRRLSVAVLVDGTYGDGNYTPRSKEELAQLDTLVKSAVGYDDKRGDKVEIVNMRFISAEEVAAQESPFEWIKNDIEGIIQTLVLGGVAILAILLVIRPLVNRLIESANPAAALAGVGGVGGMMPGGGPPLTAEELEDEEGTIDIDRVKGRVKSSMYRKINELVEKHPEETLSIIRQWVFKDS